MRDKLEFMFGRGQEFSQPVRRKKIFLILGAILFLIGLLGGTYAFLNLTLQGTKKQVITAGTLSLELIEDENNLTIENAYPMYDEVGMLQEAFTFRLVNNGAFAVNYKLKLVDITPDTLTTEQKCGDLGEITASSPTNCRTVSYPDTLRAEMLALCQRWYGEETTEEKCVSREQAYDASIKTFEDVIDVNINGGYLKEDTRVVSEIYPDNYVVIAFPRLEEYDVKYGLTKDGKTAIGLLSDITGEVIDSGAIGASPEAIEYELRLWIKDTVTDNSAISGKSLSYRVDVEISQKKEYTVATNASELVDDGTTGENCETYNDGTDTFLVGQCSNNYVWYSGKLWRVVLKNNETGAVKIVTDNAITAIPYNASGNTAFKDSYMDQWLNQEFLPTLHDYEDYLVVDSLWDATTDSSSTPARPKGTTTVERVVGLLNAYEYYTTYAQSGGLATYSTGYLRNGVDWWLITPYNASYVRHAYNDGYLAYSPPLIGNGARPSVNLKSEVQIVSGSGSQSDPYILKGDIQETTGGTTLLSTRYSGEYITFNNELYRIVEVENGLTKITAVDKPSNLSSNKFHSASGVTSFASASIKTDLENYYQGLKNTNETAFNMIQPNTTWYLGGVGDGNDYGNYHYKASICASVDASVSMSACTEKATSTTASIALPRAGEMFTSQITRGTKDAFWTLTPKSTSSVRYVNSIDGTLNSYYPANGYGARPSMYLKSTIKIASGNVGNGTYEYPYKIELGA